MPNKEPKAKREFASGMAVARMALASQAIALRTPRTHDLRALLQRLQHIIQIGLGYRVYGVGYRVYGLGLGFRGSPNLYEYHESEDLKKIVKSYACLYLLMTCTARQ